MSEETKDAELAAMDAADEPRLRSKPLTDSAEALARALQGVRQNGDHWLAPSPASQRDGAPSDYFAGRECRS